MSQNDTDKINPDDVQKELEELMKSKFGDKVQVVTQSFGNDPLDENQFKSNNDESASKAIDLEFNYKPKDVYAYLSDYVIGQHEAKKALSIAICDHYNHVRKHLDNNLKIDHYSKQNVLLLGPTGVGKTYLVKKLAELVGVPFVKADATKFTEAGYVGANIEDTIRDLITQADGNIHLAQYGIVYIDEADKLAGSRRVAGKDISGRGVQNGMLKLLEDTDVETKSPFDMMAQMNSMLSGSEEKAPKTISTKNILFILSGAFSGLEEVIKKRLNVGTIGLAEPKITVESDHLNENLFEKVTTKDLSDFGLEPELIGRLPVRVHCHNLSDKNLFNILKNSKESIIHQYIDAFDSYGVDIHFTDCALKLIAKLAQKEKTGARSLMTVIEQALREYKFELPSTSISQLTVDRNLVENPQKVLESLLQLN